MRWRLFCEAASLPKEKNEATLRDASIRGERKRFVERNLQSDVEDPGRARKQENPIGWEPMTDPAVFLKGASFCHPCQPVEQTRGSSIVDA